MNDGKQIEELLNPWRNHLRSGSKVQALALAHIAELEARMRNLGAMKLALEQLAADCRGDERPESPIVDGHQMLSRAMSRAQPTLSG